MDMRHFKNIFEIIFPETLIFPDMQQFFVFSLFFKKLARYPPFCAGPSGRAV